MNLKKSEAFIDSESKNGKSVVDKESVNLNIVKLLLKMNQ
jgi:hypothetical protein